MTKAPTVHKMPSIGMGHTKILRRKTINKQARTRQKKRKYATNSKQWKIIRGQHMDAHPNNLLCACCKEKGLIRSMTDVDHIDGNTYNNDPNNFQSLCKSCHSRKTARENCGFGNNGVLQ